MAGKLFIQVNTGFPDFYTLSTYNSKLQMNEMGGIVPDDFVKLIVTSDEYRRLSKGEKIQFRLDEVKDGS